LKPHGQLKDLVYPSKKRKEKEKSLLLSSPCPVRRLVSHEAMMQEDFIEKGKVSGLCDRTQLRR
jgi:hypothetical protein